MEQQEYRCEQCAGAAVGRGDVLRVAERAARARAGGGGGAGGAGRARAAAAAAGGAGGARTLPAARDALQPRLRPLVHAAGEATSSTDSQPTALN